MTQVISLTKSVHTDTATVPELIALAFRQTARQSVGSVIPRPQVRALLLNGVVEAVTRGLRDVDLLCDEALARLSEEENLRSS